MSAVFAIIIAVLVLAIVFSIISPNYKIEEGFTYWHGEYPWYYYYWNPYVWGYRKYPYYRNYPYYGKFNYYGGYPYYRKYSKETI